MEAGEGLSLEQIRVFLEGAENIRFEGRQRPEVYEWVTRTVREQRYDERGRAEKGVLRAYVGKMLKNTSKQVSRPTTSVLPTTKPTKSFS